MSRYDSDIRPPHAGYMPAIPTAPLTPADGVTLSLDLDEILNATCKFAADLLKVDHSVLLVFLPGRDAGHVISEYPPYGTKGLTIPLREPG